MSSTTYTEDQSIMESPPQAEKIAGEITPRTLAYLQTDMDAITGEPNNGTRTVLEKGISLNGLSSNSSGQYAQALGEKLESAGIGVFIYKSAESSLLYFYTDNSRFNPEAQGATPNELIGKQIDDFNSWIEQKGYGDQNKLPNPYSQEATEYRNRRQKAGRKEDAKTTAQSIRSINEASSKLADARPRSLELLKKMNR